jgi:CheY-like chemotaxis protein
MPHVLVIEDDPSAQTLYGALLQQYGLDCTIVGDGERALATLRRTRFDAVVLDLLLPKVNGFEVLRELKCISPDLLSRVIVCSAVAEATLADWDDLRLVRRFLPKPVDIHVLADEVSEAAGGLRAPGIVPRALVRRMPLPLRDAS